MQYDVFYRISGIMPLKFSRCECLHSEFLSLYNRSNWLIEFRNRIGSEVDDGC